jgi:hypothetical protein
MKSRTSKLCFFHFPRVRTAILAGLLLLPFVPATASAQNGRSKPVLGEDYHFETTFAWWKPSLFGSVSSDRLDLIGSRVDLVDDLGFGEARFKNLRFTLRPGRKHKVRFQYTPLTYEASGVLARQVTFAGHVFDAALPIDSKLSWKVWRLGYEWDFLYRPRGYLGVVVEARKTELTAELASLAVSGSVAAEAPLPAIGVVTRVYVLPDLAVNFELTGFKMPEINGEYQGTYMDMDISATVNFTNNFGASFGWRMLDTNIRVNQDFGDLKFSGFWFGGAVRY